MRSSRDAISWQARPAVLPLWSLPLCARRGGGAGEATVRFANFVDGICVAPQYVAKQLLRLASAGAAFSRSR
jgi:hypothetical protein